MESDKPVPEVHSSVVEFKDGGELTIKTTNSSSEIKLDATLPEQTKQRGSLEQIPEKNPFTSSGKLSRKADYILSHSTITRTELRISDPDMPSRAANECDSRERLLNGEAAADHQATVVVDEAPIKQVVVGMDEKLPSVALVNGYTGSPVEAEVAQVLLQMPDKDRAEQVKLEGRGCCRRCRRCCVVQ